MYAFLQQVNYIILFLNKNMHNLISCVSIRLTFNTFNKMHILSDSLKKEKTKSEHFIATIKQCFVYT